jgi:hypothetical protein
MSDFPPLPAHPNGTQTNHPSYAEAAAHNAPPSSVQPHPDKNLLYTGPSPTHPTTVPDVESKVTVVPHDWPAHPTTSTSTSLHIDVAQSASDTGTDDDQDANVSGAAKRKARKQRERRDKVYKSKRNVNTFWRRFTDHVVHPGPGLIGGAITLRLSLLILNRIH